MKKKNEGTDKDQIILDLSNNPIFGNEIKVFKRVLGNFLWFIVPRSLDVPEYFKKFNRSECSMCFSSRPKKNTCRQRIRTAVKKSEKTGRFSRFVFSEKLHGFCCPLMHGAKVYGYLVICGVKKEYDDDMLNIFTVFTESIVSNVLKEKELKKLYETIRPRAIALSTVHTVHRLISSTLDINELLPRIARLTLQIMRATRCSIKLVDSRKKTLLPKTTVDLRKKEAKLKKVRIGKYAPGRAVKYGRPIRGRDYLAVPLIDEDIIGVITIYNKVDQKPFTDFDEEIMKTLCEQSVIAIRNATLFKEQERLTMGSIKSIAAILASSTPGTSSQSASFTKIVNLVGQELRMSEYELKCMQYASLLHDAGQITLPDKVRRKQGVLTGEEFKIIKEHPRNAAIILKPLKSLKSVVPIILYHHENYDGTGYPKGLKGNEIPLGARIVGVVGSFEAMIIKKPYRKKAMSIPAALEEIKRNSGKQFDPNVVKAFLKVIVRKDVLKKVRKEIYGD